MEHCRGGKLSRTASFGILAVVIVNHVFLDPRNIEHHRLPVKRFGFTVDADAAPRAIHVFFFFLRFLKKIFIKLSNDLMQKPVLLFGLIHVPSIC